MVLARRRVLIIGESHHLWPDAREDRSTWTQYCVQRLVDGDGYKRFWPSIERTVLGKVPTAGERSQFW